MADINNARYNLAKAWNRIGARIIDMLVVSAVTICFALLIIGTDRSGIKHSDNLAQTWRYLLIAIVTAIVFCLYYVYLPFKTKGKTIGFLIFKLRLINLITTKNFLINILKREFFLWMIFILGILILGITLCFLNQDEAHKLLMNLFTFSNNDDYTVAIVILQTVLGIGSLIVIFVIINMCIFNSKRCFIDHISDTVVIKLIDVASHDIDATTNKKIKKIRRNYGLPGEIVASAEDEINSL